VLDSAPSASSSRLKAPRAPLKEKLVGRRHRVLLDDDGADAEIDRVVAKNAAVVQRDRAGAILVDDARVVDARAVDVVPPEIDERASAARAGPNHALLVFDQPGVIQSSVQTSSSTLEGSLFVITAPLSLCMSIMLRGARDDDRPIV